MTKLRLLLLILVLALAVIAGLLIIQQQSHESGNALATASYCLSNPEACD